MATPHRHRTKAKASPRQVWREEAAVIPLGLGWLLLLIVLVTLAVYGTIR